MIIAGKTQFKQCWPRKELCIYGNRIHDHRFTSTIELFLCIIISYLHILELCSVSHKVKKVK